MQQQNELISIIIPAYNHGKFIKECIQSFINQTYQNLELIILNDGSKDDTHEQIETLREFCEKRFTKFTYIKKQNEGVTKTLNQGIGLAQSEYILTLASDDKALKNNAVEILYKALKEEEAKGRNTAVVCGDMAIIDNDSKKAYWTPDRKIAYNNQSGKNFETTTAFFTSWRKGFDGFDYQGPDFGSYPSLLIGHYMPNGCLIKKSAILETGGYSEAVCIEDWDMWIKLAKNYSFKFIPELLFACRWHTSNSQITREQAIRRDIFRIVKAEEKFCQNNNFHGVWKTAFRLSRSGLMSSGDFAFLMKSTGPEDFKYIPGDITFYFIHKIKAVLRIILPAQIFETLKRFGRRMIKYSP